MRTVLTGLLAGATAFVAVALLTADDDSPARAADTEGGAAVFAEMGCGSCHTFAGVTSDAGIGPPLDEAVRNHTRESLRRAIVSPPAGGMMPTDFGTRLGPEKLDALVDFLLAAAR